MDDFHTQWLCWQLVDSAFPSGGFSHSGGLEAAVGQGLLRPQSQDSPQSNETMPTKTAGHARQTPLSDDGGLDGFLQASLHQAGSLYLPMVMTAHTSRDGFFEADEVCQAALFFNQVAAVASKQQGRSLLLAAVQAFGQPLRGRQVQDQRAQDQRAQDQQADDEGNDPQQSDHVNDGQADGASSVMTQEPSGGQQVPDRDSLMALDTALRAGECVGHYYPIFGAVCRLLGLPRRRTADLFLFTELRSQISAAVRLNLVGPMKAQAVQAALGQTVEKIINQYLDMPLEEITQTAPLIELAQMNQGRLYTRLFQS